MKNQKVKNIEIKPSYYDSFSCIAEQCSFTCCEQWKIAVDEKSWLNWQSLFGVACHVTEQEGQRIMKMGQDKRCPFLRQDGLCKMVIDHGEECLSHTCHTFPRQIHTFANRTEKALVSCCPAVIDLWRDQEESDFEGTLSESEMDVPFALRQLFMNLLSSNLYSENESFLIAFYMILDWKKNGEPNAKSVLSYCDEKLWTEVAQAMREIPLSQVDQFEERNELFLDFSDNYRKEGYYKDYLEDLVALAEQYSESYEEEKIEGELNEFYEILDDYQMLFRQFLLSELFSNSLIEDADEETFFMMVQWIAMEYGILRHGLFLKWMSGEKKPLSYETIRNHMVLIARMTGYDEDDIQEYMEDSFQSLIWEWGYFALLIREKE